MFITNKKTINLSRPRPYEEVGAKFLISGWISKSLLFSNSGIDNTIFLDIIGMDGQNWRSGQDLDIKIGSFLIFKRKFWFTTVFQFYNSDVSWIKESQGRLNLKFSTRRIRQLFFVPIIVKEFEPLGGPDIKIMQRHGKMGEIIKQYEIDLKNYNKEMEEIRQSNPHKINVTENDEWMTLIDIKDDDLLKYLLRILSSSETEFKNQYNVAKQAQAEKTLSEKYKDAIRWRGPLFRGTVNRWRGFIMKVHSNDHGKHFHIIHGEKGIDARFSFPEIELINYKRSKKIISKKKEKEISDLFKDQKLFEKLKKEFDKKSKI